MFEQPQNLFTNLVLNFYEKSCTHNSHNLLIYNTLLLDPNQFIPPIGFTFIGPILNFMKGYFTSFMILKMIICANVNKKIRLLYIPNFFHLNMKLGKTVNYSITPKNVIVHYGFHYILSEFEHFYHGETSQPSNEQGLIDTNSKLIH